ncbi:MAG: ribonucleoside-diphosphate reductase alpha chain [Myxococcales bacterium]|nr:ribonucleoside-diphosphate reductase alpha chain [Myxococcales bacterium]
MLEKQDVRKNRNGRQTDAAAGQVRESGRQDPVKPESRAELKSSPSSKGKARKGSAGPGPGLELRRYFTKPGDDGFTNVDWELRTAAITGENGKMVFEQRDVEVPKTWSQTATNVVVQKYFRGTVGTPQRERSVRQLISRVADTITDWGRKDGYFANEESARVFNAELKHLLVEQKMAFNSPVWFNVGSEARPQCSACFINSVEDTMGSILTLAKTEGMLFKYGSGTGTNLSPLRSSRELLNGGGTASGPVSFMRGFDAFAGVIKSGGKTRRAAKMVILNVDHPDVEEFIWCKAKEEKKAWTLIDAGYDGSFDGEAYKSIFFQNSNNSVRVTDDFMEAVQKDRDFSTRAVRDGSPVETFKARDLWRAIAEAAWQCGDPGLQYDTTINAWHTSANTARINASNPCSEYMYLDDSACNLASLNLRKFVLSHAGEFDVPSFKKAIETTIIAQEIIVGNAEYPTERIRDNSFRFRPLGLGYANLGALLMSRGLPYDSAPARAYAGAITAIMTGWAYRTSAVIAREVTGPFDGYAENEEPFLRVMKKHRHHVDKIDAGYVPLDMMEGARHAWDDAIAVGSEHGFRNGQATVLAPTGTIGFMMDCDTTGIEPDIALIKYKRLVGGGMIKIVNNTLCEALEKLGYNEDQVKAIADYVDTEETIEGAPGLKDEHLPVFDCAFRAANGTRSIQGLGHIRMMAAAQPFISGAISKTVNLPPEATIEDVQDAYMEAWKDGLKAIAIYRDGCKRTQPLSTSRTDPGLVKGGLAVAPAPITSGPPAAVRKKLPDERQSFTHKFAIAGHEGYIHVGLYETGEPGEIFVKMAKEGSTISGLMDSFATAISLALQHGVPLRLLVDKFSRTRFEPYGYTENPEIPRASSIMDYLFRWLGAKFVKRDTGEGMEAPAVEASAEVARVGEVVAAAKVISKVEVIDATKASGHANGNGHGPAKAIGNGNYSFIARTDAPTCPECGSIMIPNGSCHKCVNCGTTSGCS